MSEHQPPRILVFEPNETLGLHIQTLLAGQGWNILWEKEVTPALDQLDRSKETPFHLFLTSFQSLTPEGENIFKKARSLSPLTQRMFMLGPDRPELAVKAINKGGINACILLPLVDEELIRLIQNCLAQFHLAMKGRQIKRTTANQNKQMFEIAQKLKKKAETTQENIEEKKAKLQLLRTRLKPSLNKKGDHEGPTLANKMDQNKIPGTVQAFQQEFFFLCTQIKNLFDEIAAKTGLEALDLESFVSREGDAAKATRTQEKAGAGQPLEKTPGVGLIPKILGAALTAGPDPDRASDKPVQEGDPPGLDGYLDLSISGDQTEAYVQKKMDLQGWITLSILLDFLAQQNITQGIIAGEAIEAWISKPGKERLLVAKGQDPVHGKDGFISFQFKKDYTNPGKLMPDGTIDFRDRGEIPYVVKGQELARKTPAQAGQNGTSIFGTAILAEEPKDPVFSAGNGTQLSDDGLIITAALDGQPHVDALGNITVNPELMIQGDVDFETGNIDFNGNILVKGTIKQGFKVKGINLIAQEVEGGLIDLSGDLNVSAGITNAFIEVKGNVVAKFINHSTIMGFGDLMVQKEIIDSEILLSGTCKNTTGHIIASTIMAKRGIEAGKIGTTSSKSVLIKVGTGDHIETLIRKIDQQIKESLVQVQELKEQIKTIEIQDQKLYELITQTAQIQEKAQGEIKKLKNTPTDPGRTIEIQKTADKIKRLMETAQSAERKLDKIFETQDGYARKTDEFNELITRIEENNKDRVIQKKALGRFADKTPPLARVAIQGKVTQDTAIHGPNAFMTIREDMARCQIQEIALTEDGLHFYEMTVSPL